MLDSKPNCSQDARPMRPFLILCAAIAIFSTSTGASTWFEDEQPNALARLLANIHPAGTAPGVIVASPQRSAPNYFYHWTRDSALTIDVLLSLFERTPKSIDEKIFRNYISLSLAQQDSNALTGFGEPKFEVDGTPFMGPWGRPQNDGPALRAIAMMHYARILQRWGRRVDATLYDGKLPSQSLIKRDLEFVAHHWREPSFDLWEEVLGDHFYTRMVQRRALVEGAAFARSLGDGGAADFYASEARQLSMEITKHFDGLRGIIIPTLNRVGGLDYKTSDLDVAVILAVLHGHTEDGFLPFNDVKLGNSLNKLISAFAKLYPINSRFQGVAIGRYPEDQYSGGEDPYGNPWVLATLAVAEFYFRTGDFARARSFVERVHTHANSDGSLSEQMNRITGFMTSASDLTWNYAAVISTHQASQRKSLLFKVLSSLRFQKSSSR